MVVKVMTFDIYKMDEKSQRVTSVMKQIAGIDVVPLAGFLVFDFLSEVSPTEGHLSLGVLMVISHGRRKLHLLVNPGWSKPKIKHKYCIILDIQKDNIINIRICIHFIAA